MKKLFYKTKNLDYFICATNYLAPSKHIPQDLLVKIYMNISTPESRKEAKVKMLKLLTP